MKHVRCAAKAIIIEDGQLLVTHNVDRDGDWYLLPGGGQHHGESIDECLRRECLEEIGAEVEVGDLRFVRDYIGKNHEFAGFAADEHQIELMFECRLKDGARPGRGTTPDIQQVGVKWFPVDSLDGIPLFPQVLKKHLPHLEVLQTTLYLGDVN